MAPLRIFMARLRVLHEMVLCGHSPEMCRTGAWCWPNDGGLRAHSIRPYEECITGANPWRPHKLPVVGIIFNF